MQLTYRKRQAYRMIYTLLGYSGMNPTMEGRNAMISQDFYRTDNDCPKGRCSRSSASRFLHMEYTFPWICLLDLSAVHLLYRTCGLSPFSILFPTLQPTALSFLFSVCCVCMMHVYSTCECYILMQKAEHDIGRFSMPFSDYDRDMVSH